MFLIYHRYINSGVQQKAHGSRSATAPRETEGKGDKAPWSASEGGSGTTYLGLSRDRDFDRALKRIGASEESYSPFVLLNDINPTSNCLPSTVALEKE